MVLTNLSSWALRVQAPGGLVTVKPRLGSSALSDVLTDGLMAGAPLDPVDGAVLVGPGARAVYPALVSSGVTVRYDARYTAGRYATNAFGTWLEEKTTPRRQAALNSVVECGRAVGDTWSAAQDHPALADVLFSLIDTGGTCRSTVRTLQELSQEPEPTTVAEELRSIARNTGTSFWEDVAKYGSRAVVTTRW